MCDRPRETCLRVVDFSRLSPGCQGIRHARAGGDRIAHLFQMGSFGGIARSFDLRFPNAANIHPRIQRQGHAAAKLGKPGEVDLGGAEEHATLGTGT